MTDYSTSPSLSRMDVSSGRRRRWSAADKGRIVAESFERGVSASDVARRHDMSPQQLFQWRRQARSGALVVPVEEDFPFAEVRVRQTGAGGSGGCASFLDLTVGDASVRVTTATDLKLLVLVVRALREART